MYRIKVCGEFSGLHSAIRDRVHGHKWQIEAHFLVPGQGEVRYVVPHSEVESLLLEFLATLEGQQMEQFFMCDLDPTTDEMIAMWIYKKIRERLAKEETLNGKLALEKVTVSHRSGVSVEYFEGLTNVISKLA